MENIIIDNLLNQKDKTYLELVAQPDNIENIARTVTAFINTKGGDLILGIDANKNIYGIDNVDVELKKIHEHVVAHVKPTAPIFFNVINYNGKHIILIRVWKGSRKPYQYQRIFYSRKDENTDISSIKDIDNMIERRKEADAHWERMIINAEFEDLDTEEIKKTCEAYREYKGETKPVDTEEWLMEAGLMRDGNLTNACILLFGKHPSHFLPQSRVRLTIYPSHISGNQFIDDKYFEGNIFKNIYDIFNYLDAVFGKGFTVNGLERINHYNYPQKAFREGILNAIIHRNYYHIKSFLQISIFSDRTEISNYGNLPDGINVEDLKTEHHSILQNPDIAFICFLRKYAELLGSGTLRMIADCKQNSYEEPRWITTTNAVTVMFQGVSHHKKIEGTIEGTTEGTVEGTTEGTVKKLNKKMIVEIESSIEKIIKGSTQETKNKITQILLKIYQKPGMRVPEIEKATHIPAKTIERYIKQLKDANLIAFRGNSLQTGGYHLTTKNYYNAIHDGDPRKVQP